MYCRILKYWFYYIISYVIIFLNFENIILEKKYGFLLTATLIKSNLVQSIDAINATLVHLSKIFGNVLK